MTKINSGQSVQSIQAALAPLLDFQKIGVPLDELRTLIGQTLLPHLTRYDLPAFQSMFNAFPSSEAKLGAEIALDYNQGVTNWQVSPGGAMLEELCCQKLCQLFGLAETADATFMYSGTYANQQAIYMAIHRFAERQYGFDYGEQGLAGFPESDKIAIAVSADAHFSLRHAARMLGLGEANIIKLPVDVNRRIDPIAADRVISDAMFDKEIVAVVATAGTTSTGSIDPILPLADIAFRHNAWLHVDGAYGYAYKLVPDWAHLYEGDDLADSISWDPHKQLEAPIPSSVLFVKHWQAFARMSLYSGYFNRREDREPNPGLKSPPTTRPLSALPLVSIFRGKGLDQIAYDLRQPLVAISSLARYLQEQSDFELFHQPDTGILCFQYRPIGFALDRLNRLQRLIYETIMGEGERTVSLTKIDGVQLLRLVSVAPIVQFPDFLETVLHIQAVGRKMELRAES